MRLITIPLPNCRDSGTVQHGVRNIFFFVGDDGVCEIVQLCFCFLINLSFLGGIILDLPKNFKDSIENLEYKSFHFP